MVASTSNGPAVVCSNLCPRLCKGLTVGAKNDSNERWLRPIARLAHSEQLAAVAGRLDHEFNSVPERGASRGTE